MQLKPKVESLAPFLKIRYQEKIESLPCKLPNAPSLKDMRCSIM